MAQEKKPARKKRTGGLKPVVSPWVQLHPVLLWNRTSGEIVGDGNKEPVSLTHYEYIVFTMLYEALNDPRREGRVTIREIIRRIYPRNWGEPKLDIKDGKVLRRKETKKRLSAYNKKHSVQDIIYGIRAKVESVHSCTTVIEYNRATQAYRLTSYTKCEMTLGNRTEPLQNSE